MPTTFQALRRPSLNAAFALCALTLFALAAPLCAAATGPVVSAKIGPATLSVTGGVITVTATVTDSSATISSVQADVSLNGGYYGENGVTLSNGGSGNVYTAVVPSSGNNTGSAPNIYTATVTARDASNSTTSATATGQVVQANDATPPTITSVSIGPATLPLTGGIMTVSATVTDPGKRAITSVQADVSLNGGYYGENGVTLSNGGSGNVYTAVVPSSGTNTSTAPYTYTAVVTATNDLNLRNSANATGKTVQANDSAPPTLTGVAISPATLPVTGGNITITATVTDPGMRAITSVQANVSLNGGYYGENGVNLSNGGSGNVYTAVVPSSGNNTSSAPYTYTATVTATNDLNLTKSAAATGKTVQVNDAAPPTLTGVTISPATLPVTGGNITISATVTDPGKRAITGVRANVELNGGYYGENGVVLSNGGSGSVYTAVVPSSGTNNSNAPYTYTATVTATDDLNLSNSANAAGKTVQANSGPSASLTPTLYMADAAHPTLTPASVAASSPDLTLTIDGVNFTGGATVLFNGVPLSPTAVTATQVTVVVPADLLATVGAYAVSVVNPSPGGISNSVNFNVH